MTGPVTEGTQEFTHLANTKSTGFTWRGRTFSRRLPRNLEVKGQTYESSCTTHARHGARLFSPQERTLDSGLCLLRWNLKVVLLIQFLISPTPGGLRDFLVAAPGPPVWKLEARYFCTQPVCIHSLRSHPYIGSFEPGASLDPRGPRVIHQHILTSPPRPHTVLCTLNIK